ncbi:MAG: hypothetical protein SF029_08900 [bacterium]|nr:hypothetical protein [bacterium]
MDETMQQIHQLANERGMLYRLAGKGGLTTAQRQRMEELNAKLPVIWDQYRRELASGKRYVPYAYDADRAA